MNIGQYQDLFYDIWLFHNNQIWVRGDNKIGERYEYYLDPKWKNLWI